jgi:hypothetical protein
MPRRHWFTVKVCYDGAIEEFKFMTNGRFPFHSDVNGRVCPPHSYPTYIEEVAYHIDSPTMEHI